MEIVGGGKRAQQLVERVRKAVKKNAQVDIGKPDVGMRLNSLPGVLNATIKQFATEATQLSNSKGASEFNTDIGGELKVLFDNIVGKNDFDLFGGGMMESGTGSMAMSPVGVMTMLSLSWPENVHRYMMPSSVRESPVILVKYIKSTLQRKDGTVVELPATNSNLKTINERPTLGPSAWPENLSSLELDDNLWIAANTTHETGGRVGPDADSFGLLASAWNLIAPGPGDNVDYDIEIVGVQYNDEVSNGNFSPKFKKTNIKVNTNTDGGVLFVGIGEVTWENTYAGNSATGSDKINVSVNRENGALYATTTKGLAPDNTDSSGIIKILVKAYKTTEYGNTVETINISLTEQKIMIPQGQLAQVATTRDKTMDFKAQTGGLDYSVKALDTLTKMFGNKQNNRSYNYLEEVFQDFIATVGEADRDAFEASWDASPPESGDGDLFRHRKTFVDPLAAIIDNLVRFTQYENYRIIIVCGRREFRLFRASDNFIVDRGADSKPNQATADENIMQAVGDVGGMYDVRVVSSRVFEDEDMYIYLVPLDTEDNRGIEHFSYDYALTKDYLSGAFQNLSQAITARRRDVRHAFNPAMGKLIVKHNKGQYPTQ